MYYLYPYYRGNASTYCQYAFKLFDRDNNGTLSFTEFALAMQIYSSSDLEQSLGLVWASTDSCSILFRKMFFCAGIWSIRLRQIWNNRQKGNHWNDCRYKCTHLQCRGSTRCTKFSRSNYGIMRRTTNRKDNENRIYQWVHQMHSVVLSYSSCSF